MEKTVEIPVDPPTATSLQPKACCGGKAGVGEPQGTTEAPVVIESAPSPVKDSSGCCCGHR